MPQPSNPPFGSKVQHNSKGKHLLHFWTPQVLRCTHSFHHSPHHSQLGLPALTGVATAAGDSLHFCVYLWICIIKSKERERRRPLTCGSAVQANPNHSVSKYRRCSILAKSRGLANCDPLAQSGLHLCVYSSWANTGVYTSKWLKTNWKEKIFCGKWKLYKFKFWCP